MTSLRCLRIGAVLSKYLLTDMDQICGINVCEILLKYSNTPRDFVFIDKEVKNGVKLPINTC
jgi:hypothetical protein